MEIGEELILAHLFELMADPEVERGNYTEALKAQQKAIDNLELILTGKPKLIEVFKEKNLWQKK